MSLPDLVLITRPPPGAATTARKVAEMGLTPVVAPVMAIQPAQARLPPASKLAAVLLASGNAIAALPRAYRSLPVLAVGAATAERARAAGFAKAESADGDARALMALVRSRFSPADGTLLLAAGQGQSQSLAGFLAFAGYTVERRVVYAALPVPVLPEAAAELLRGLVPSPSPGCVVLFFSADTARVFMRLVRAAGLEHALPHCEAVTIGHPAAMALEGGGWARVRVAQRPNQEEMLALLR